MLENSSTKKPAGRSVSFALGGTVWILIAWGISSLLVLPLVVTLVAASLGLSGEEFIRSSNIVTTIVLSFLYAPLMLVLVWAVFRPILEKQGWSVKRLIALERLPRIKDVLNAIPAYLIYFVITVVVFTTITLLFPNLYLDQKQNLGISAPATLLEYVLTFCMLVILPPFIEEVLFRGFLFGTLRRGFSMVVSATLTSILFGVAHGQLNLFIDTFVLGLILCYLREKTGTIWTGIFVHGIKNAIAFTLLYVFKLG